MQLFLFTSSVLCKFIYLHLYFFEDSIKFMNENKIFLDTLNSANNTLGSMKSGEIDVEKVLIEAKKILAEIKSRNFSQTESAANMATNISIDYKRKSEEFTETALNTSKRAESFNNTFKNFLAAFKNIKKESETAVVIGKNATDLILIAKSFDIQVGGNAV